MDGEGKTIEVWGRSQLDRLMNEVKINDYIRITYTGVATTANGYDMNLYYLEKRRDDGE